MCSARVGLSLEEFDKLTPVELFELMNEYNELKFNEYKENASLQRLFTMVLVNTQIKRESQFSDPKRFMPFSWEEDVSDEMLDELYNTDWEALERKYNNKVVNN